LPNSPGALGAESDPVSVADEYARPIAEVLIVATDGDPNVGSC
jgi:hypothetical protein